MAKVLVLGASGLFGKRAAEAFAAAGWQVTKFKRGSDMKAAAQGMDVIVNGLNPPAYHNWSVLIPQITEEVIAAGLASGARVVVPGNVYVFGKEPAPWGPGTPQRPVSRKGAIRAAMEARYKQASREQGLRVLILMAGDFLEAGSLQTMFSQFTLRGLKAGKIIYGGSPDTMHAYANLRDLGRAAEALVSLPDLPAHAEVPFYGHSFTARDVKAEVERQTGRNYRFGRFPWWQMRLVAPFWELAREVLEMRYLTEHPHWLDPAPMQALLPDFQMTPFVQVIADHLAVRLPQYRPATGQIASAR